MNFSILDIVKLAALTLSAVTREFIKHPTIASRIADQILTLTEPAPGNAAPAPLKIPSGFQPPV